MILAYNQGVKERLTEWADANQQQPLGRDIRSAVYEIQRMQNDRLEELREEMKEAFVAGCHAMLDYLQSNLPRDDLDEEGYAYAIIKIRNGNYNATNT